MTYQPPGVLAMAASRRRSPDIATFVAPADYLPATTQSTVGGLVRIALCAIRMTRAPCMEPPRPLSHPAAFESRLSRCLDYNAPPGARLPILLPSCHRPAGFDTALGATDERLREFAGSIWRRVHDLLDRYFHVLFVAVLNRAGWRALASTASVRSPCSQLGERRLCLSSVRREGGCIPQSGDTRSDV